MLLRLLCSFYKKGNLFFVVKSILPIFFAISDYLSYP